MVLCYKPDDILKGCDSSDLNALSGAFAINIKAFKGVKSETLKFTLEDIIVTDPETNAYPIVGSDYYPIKLEWEKNAVKPNYEVVSSDKKKDTYIHVVPSIIINNSESDKGKETIMAASTEKYVIVYGLTGVANEDDMYHVLGFKNGMQFVAESTSDDVGGRVTGSFRSLTGSGEANPNGLNFLLSTGIANTKLLFNKRFSTVAV